jgi:hypothetical protein
MDKNGSHFWNQHKKIDSITHIFEKSSEKIFKMQSGVILWALINLMMSTPLIYIIQFSVVSYSPYSFSNFYWIGLYRAGTGGQLL